MRRRAAGASRLTSDEQLSTGESAVRTKEPGDRLFAGTLNLDGDLLLTVTIYGEHHAARTHGSASTAGPEGLFRAKFRGPARPLVSAAGVSGCSIWHCRLSQVRTVR